MLSNLAHILEHAMSDGFSTWFGKRWVHYTPADPIVDANDVMLMMQSLDDMAATCGPDYDRLARLVAPYVHDATVEELSATFAADPSRFVWIFHRVLLRVLYERPLT